MFYLADTLRTQAQNITSQIVLQDCSKEASEELGYTGVSATKTKKSDIKILLLLLLLSCSVVSDSFATPWTIAQQAPLSMEFPRQEYWSRLPCLPPGIFPTQGSNPRLMHWQADSLLLSHLTVKEHQPSQVKEFSALLCMGKMQKSGLADIIPWYALSSLGPESHVFSSRVSSGCSLVVAAAVDFQLGRRCFLPPS